MNRRPTYIFVHEHCCKLRGLSRKFHASTLTVSSSYLVATERCQQSERRICTSHSRSICKTRLSCTCRWDRSVHWQWRQQASPRTFCLFAETRMDAYIYACHKPCAARLVKGEALSFPCRRRDETISCDVSRDYRTTCAPVYLRAPPPVRAAFFSSLDKPSSSVATPHSRNQEMDTIGRKGRGDS